MVLAADGSALTQLGTPAILLLLLLFYGGTMWMAVRISKRKENADGYMTSGNKIGFGVSDRKSVV